jgi:hypothetical protein
MFFKEEFRSSGFRNTPQHRQSSQSGGDASIEHPNASISQRSRDKELVGDVRTQRVCGAHSDGDEDNATHKQGGRNDSVHDDSSRRLAPGNEVGQNQDQRYHQQDMDYSAHRVAGHETEQPENEQHYRDCV